MKKKISKLPFKHPEIFFLCLFSCYFLCIITEIVKFHKY